MGVSMFTVLIIAIIAIIIAICSSIASFAWSIYWIIAIAVIAFDIYLFATNDYEKWEFAIGSILGLAAYAAITDIIVSIGSIGA